MSNDLELLRVFQREELDAALEYSNRGGQALYLTSTSFGIPGVIYTKKNKPRDVGLIFDQDVTRLTAFIKPRLLSVPFVYFSGTSLQYSLLFGEPLKRLLSKINA